MSEVRVGIVADDLTGATTVAACLAAKGVENVVVVSASCSEALGSCIPAVVLSTDSRALSPDDARSRVTDATRRLKESGATLFSKRIDTTLRGGIGYEIDAMLDALSGDHVAIVVPSMPGSRRIMVGGFSIIDSVLLTDTAVARDVRTPVTQPHVPTLIQAQSSHKVAEFHIDDVCAGSELLAKKLLASRNQGTRIFVVDAINDEDVNVVAQAVTGLAWDVVGVDPGPLTTAYALANGIRTAPPEAKASLRAGIALDSPGTVVVVAGSATGVTREQIAELVSQNGTFVLDVAVAPMIAGGKRYDDEYAKVMRRLEGILANDAPKVIVVVLHSSLTGELVDMNSVEDCFGIERGTGPSRLATSLGKLGSLVMRRVGESLAGVYLTGGDIMISTVRAMEAEGISLEGYVIPQSDQGHLVGGPFDDLPVVGKGGLTGDKMTAAYIVNRIFDERKVA